MVGLLVIFAGCGGEPPLGAAEPAVMLEVRGLLVEVRADSLTKVDSLTIRDGEGNLRTFKVEGFLGFTPSHLREHRALALPITVRYIENIGRTAGVECG